MLKKLKLKKEKRKKKEDKRKKGEKRKTPQNCKSSTQRQSFITTVKSVTEYTHIHIHP